MNIDLLDRIMAEFTMNDLISFLGSKANKSLPLLRKPGNLTIKIHLPNGSTGNPPYIRKTRMSEGLKNYINKNYFSAFKQYDIYMFFDKEIKTVEGGK
jgi:hypothetical protein